MTISKVGASLLFALLIICLAHSSNSLSSPLHFMQHLNGTRKGDRANGLIELKQYLARLGYMDHNNKSSHSIAHLNDDLFDETLESAIKKYQGYFNHNITGFLDQETVDLLSGPRCGVPDPIKGTNSHVWPPGLRILTFSYVEGGRVGQEESTQIINAMLKWKAVSPFNFWYTGETIATVMIGIVRLFHGDEYPFDGPGGVFAHAFFPPVGLMHFDADDSWDTLAWPRSRRLDLQSAALHELGHILGLEHSNKPEDVMYPGLRHEQVKRVLSEGDIQAIRALYPS